MVLIETPIFTKLVQELLSDTEYERLQNQLVAAPDKGRLIPKSGGLRKIRCAAKGRGTRGGARIIYYWLTQSSQILMLYIYAKADQGNLSANQLKQLKKIIDEEYL